MYRISLNFDFSIFKWFSLTEFFFASLFYFAGSGYTESALRTMECSTDCDSLQEYLYFI